MPVTVESGTTLPFDRFWRWLKHHANCVVRAGTPDTWLLDHEAFHWHLEEDEQRNPVVQLVWGKHTVGEMVLDVRDVLFVQATPDPDGAEGHFLFELVAGQGEPGAVYHFLLAHGLEGEDEPERPGLKH